MKSIIFWDVMPCSLLSCNRRFGGTYRLRLQGLCLPPAYLLVLAEIISSTLKMEAICSSETSVATQQTTRRHISEDDTLHNHHCQKTSNPTCSCLTIRIQPQCARGRRHTDSDLRYTGIGMNACGYRGTEIAVLTRRSWIQQPQLKIGKLILRVI
jgi:hypothetical protein